MSDPGRVVILGAGPTGLGAAYRLNELGHHDWIVAEGREGPGGLAASVVDERGFTWDLGGHVQFSHYAYYDAVLDRALGVGGWLEHERNAAIWIADRFVPFPLQHNLHHLPPELCARALAGLEAAAATAPAASPRSFHDWVLQSAGAELAELFFTPYNEKVWGYPLTALDWRWIGERVAPPDLERVRRALASGRDETSWGPNRQFRFPRQGGTGAIWRGVAALLPPERLRYGTAVRRIDLAARTVELDGGERWPWQALISTIPLDRLTAMARGLPQHAVESGRRLVKSAVHVVGVGLRHGQPEPLRRKTWIYFPAAESPYYRVTVFSNYSPSHVPAGDGLWSLMAEVCETQHRPVDADALPRAVVEAMRADGLVETAAEVVSLWHRRESHGYPTPFVGRDEVVDPLLAALEGFGVFSRGRFGAWKYEVSNQDHAFMQGVELAERLLGSGDEPTLRDPVLVNGGCYRDDPLRLSPTPGGGASPSRSARV